MGSASVLCVRFETGFSEILGLIVVSMFFAEILRSRFLSLATSIKAMETLIALANSLTMPLTFTSDQRRIERIVRNLPQLGIILYVNHFFIATGGKGRPPPFPLLLHLIPPLG